MGAVFRLVLGFYPILGRYFDHKLLTRQWMNAAIIYIFFLGVAASFEAKSVTPSQCVLFGLASSGGGGITGTVGLTVSSTGFSRFDLSTKTGSSLGLNTDQFVGTAFAFDPTSQKLYMEEVKSSPSFFVFLFGAFLFGWE